MKTENLSVLKINKLTQEQYDAALAAGKINSNELYLTPEEPIDLSPYATKEELETAKSGISSELAGKQATITGAASTIVKDDLATSKVLISNSSGKVAASTVTSAELGNLSGVTSNIQTQLNGKLSTSGTAANASKLGNIAAADYATTASVETKIANLNGVVTGEGKYVTAISQTKGKITATLGDIAKDDIPDHADTSDKFGKGNGTNFGHLKLSDSTASDSDVDGGIAATPKAVKEAYTLADSAKSAADAAANQNAFSSIIVGENEYHAPNTTSSLELIGNNVSIIATSSGKTGDITVTLGVADGSTSAKGLVQLTDSTTSTSTTTAATPNAVKQAHTLAGSAKSAADGAKSRADSAYELAGTKLDANAKAVGAADADKLGGQEPSYYATASGLSEVSGVANATKTLSETNEKAIEAIKDGTTGILADAKKYTNEQLNSYSKTTDIANTYETKSDVSTKIQTINQAITTEAQTRSGADEQLQDQINTLNRKTSTSNGDAGKSIRTIANEELTAQLIPESAKESLDTLQEIAAWIQGHPDSVSAMNIDILDVRKEVYGTDDGKAPASGDNKGKSRIDNIDTAIAGINNALAGKQATITGAATTITSSNLTVNRALISDNAGKVAVSEITTTELGHLDGVTSNIQDQFKGIATTYATKQELGTEASARENADNALGNRISTVETAVGTGGSVETRIAAALKEAKEYADQSETDAIDAAKEYVNGKETAITQAYNAKIEAMVATSSGSGNFIKAISQTDGKISYTKGNISASEIPQHTFNSTGTATTGYLGNGTNYGHLKLSDTVNSASDVGESSGTAATPKAVGTVQKNVETLGGTVDSIGANVNQLNIAYGTCSTAAATAEKAITITGYTNWKLAAGSVIAVVFSKTNSASNPKLNVNGTGAKPIKYGNSTITTSNLSYGGYANRPMIYVYDGTSYHFIAQGYDSGNTYMRTYRQGKIPESGETDWNHDYPILASRTLQDALGLSSGVVTEGKYTTVYGLVPTVEDNIITINPTTGLVKANKMDLRSTLNVVGNTSLNTLEVGSTANIKGAADFDSTLNVDGATTLKETSATTLSTSGKATLKSLEVTNETELKSTLKTSGKATLNSLEVTNASALKGAVTASSTLKVAGKITGENALEITGNSDLSGGVDIGGVTTHTEGHVYLTGVSGTSTANTTQLVFGSSDTNTQHIALSSNDNALVINPNTSAITPNQIVLYLNQQSKFPGGITGGAITTTGLTVNGAAKVTGTSTLAGVTATTLLTSGKATLNSLEVSGTSKLTGALTASSASFSSGVSVDGQFTANGAAMFDKDYGVQIGSGVKLTYDDTKKCLNFTFL